MRIAHGEGSFRFPTSQSHTPIQTLPHPPRWWLPARAVSLSFPRCRPCWMHRPRRWAESANRHKNFSSRCWTYSRMGTLEFRQSVHGWQGVKKYEKTRCSPRTRMLTRMLMVQMSKHMDMQSRRTLFCNSLFERCSKLQLKLNGNYSSLREILACAILARPQWDLARGQFFKLSLRDLARRWIPEIWCIFAVHISPVTSLQCGVWSVACGV